MHLTYVYSISQYVYPNNISCQYVVRQMMYIPDVYDNYCIFLGIKNSNKKFPKE